MRRYRTQEAERAYEDGLREGAKRANEDPLTMDRIREMSQEEVAARLPEVHAVLGGES